jgi:hypothetical protein
VTLVLAIRSEGSAGIRSFLPSEAEPTQVFDHGVIKVRLGSIGIEIFVAQNQSSLGGERAQVRDPEGAGMAQV